MTFSLTDWFANFVLTSVANRLVTPNRAKELESKLENAVNNWAKELGLEYVHAPIVKEVKPSVSHTSSKSQQALREQLEDGSIPNEDTWFNALMECWEITREGLLLEERDDFYAQNHTMAEQQLRSLAKQLEIVCVEDEKLFRTNTYKQLSKPFDKDADLNASRPHSYTLDLADEKIAQLTSVISNEKAEKLEKYRELYREGKTKEAYSKILALKSDDTWKDLENSLKARINKIAAIYTVNLNKDIKTAANLVKEAFGFDSKIDLTVINSFIAYHKDGAKAALSYLMCPNNIDTFNFKLAMILESGKIDDLISQIKDKPTNISLNAESKRLYALALLCKKDLLSAQVEIQKALDEKPNWESVRIASALINYYNALSPIVIPERLIRWPEPVEWDYVKRDDASIESLTRAQAIFEDLSKSENNELRAEFEIWQLACLANNSSAQDKAKTLCHKRFSVDPGDPRLLAWASMRGYEFDYSQAVTSLSATPVEQFDYIPRVIALIILYLDNDAVNDATNFLNKNKGEFSKRDLNDLWYLWYAQVLLTEDKHSEALKTIENITSNDMELHIRTIVLRGMAKKTDKWDSYIKHLEGCYKQTGEGGYLFECCRLKASLLDWNYIVPRVKELLKVVGTSSVLEFVLSALYQAKPKQLKFCLELLDDNIGMFENGELPSHVRRLKIYCQKSLGLLSQALIEAEETFQKDGSTENLVALMNMQFHVGDRGGLVFRARQLIKQDDVKIANLLIVAGLLISENKELACNIWKKACECVSDDESYIGELITLGYSLGLDEELAPLLNILQKHAISGEGIVKLVNIEEMKSFFEKKQEKDNYLNKKYGAGEISVHVLSSGLNVPLVKIYHEIPMTNSSEDSVHLRPTIFVRHGGKSLQETPLISEGCRLHLDVSALLLASHLDILDKVEESFRPLRISPLLPAALQHQKSLLVPHQPSQQKIYSEILSLIKEEKIHVTLYRSRSVVKSKSMAKRMGSEWTATLEKILSQNGYLVEFFPLKRHDNDLRAVRLRKPYKGRVINCRSLVKSLRRIANLSEGAYARILKKLGECGSEEPKGSLPEHGENIYLSKGVAYLLGGANLLSLVCEYFQVHIAENCIRNVEQEIEEFEKSKSLITWVQSLSDRVSYGLEEDGAFEVISKLETENKDQVESENESDIDINNDLLTDMLLFKAQKGDVIWIDDRFCNSFAHRDGAPIIGVNEVLKALLEKGVISEETYYEKLLQLRKENFRYLPIDAMEINYHLKQAQIVHNAVVETEELSIIRKYYASCLLDSERLQCPPVFEGAANVNGETTFIVGVLRAIQTAIVDQWNKTSFDNSNAEALADWIYTNLHIGMFSIRHLRQKDAMDNDGIDLLGLDIGSAYIDGISLLSIPLHKKTEQESPQKQYFDWLESRISRPRFKADPSAIVATTHVIENYLLGAIDKAKEDTSHESSFILLWQKLFLNLPECIRNEINLPADNLEWLGIRTLNSLHIGNIHFLADDFWPAVKNALSGEQVVLKALEPKLECFVERREGEKITIDFKDSNSSTLCSYKDDIMLLLNDDFDKREKVLDSNRSWFDYDENIYKKALSEILLMTDPQKRVEEVYKLRQASGALFYDKLREDIIEKHKFSYDKLMPVSMERLSKYYQLSTKEEDFAINIENAAKKLLLDEGLETALIRLSCLPVKLPELLVVEFCNLSIQSQCDLLAKLKTLCLSPLSKLHLLNLVLNSSENTDLINNNTDELLNELFVNSNSDDQFELLKTILNWVNNEASYLSEIMQWPTSLKLGIIWAHSNALCSMFIAGGVVPNDLAKLLNARSSVSTEIVIRDQESWCDVLHPKRFNRARLLIDGLANILEDKKKKIKNDLKLNEKISAYISNKENIADTLMFIDPLLMKDNLSSLFGGDRGKHLSIFDPEMPMMFSSDKLRHTVKDSVKSLSSDPNSDENWLKLLSILGDLPIYEELSETLVKLFKSLDLEYFIEDNPKTALLALRVGANQAVHMSNDQIRTKLEGALFDISIFFAKGTSGVPTDDETLLHMNNKTIAMSLIEIALSISLNPDSPSETTRNFSKLTEKIFNIWPLTADAFSGISGLVQELPAEQLHGMWPLVLANRAIKKH